MENLVPVPQGPQAKLPLRGIAQIAAQNLLQNVAFFWSSP